MLLPLIAAGLVGAAGCGDSGPLDAARKSVTATQGLVDLLKSIRDPGSATAATVKIRPALDECSQALKAMAAMSGDESVARGSKAEVAKLAQDSTRLQSELKQEMTRLESLHGLPPSFWTEFRTAQVAMLVDTLDGVGAAIDPALLGPLKTSLQTLQKAYQQYGPDQVVEVEISGGRQFDQDEAVERLRKAAGAGTTVATLSDPDKPGTTIALAFPIADVEALYEKIDFGTVTDFIPERCAILLAVTEDLAGPYAGMTPEEKKQAEQLAADQERMKKEQEEMEKRQREEQERMAAEQKRMQEEQERQRLAEEERQRPPDPGKANYYEKLLANVKDPQAPHHQSAMEQLLKMKPSDVADKNVRKQIANAFRELVTGAANSPTNRGDAVKGLVLWAGRFSVPVLLELLKDASQQVDDAVLDGLAQYPTVEGAEALAPMLKDSQRREPAIEALKTMGELAEPPVLKLLPSDDPQTNIAALGVLGECGGKASQRIMQRAAQSENEEVAAAARSAAARIRERQAK